MNFGTTGAKGSQRWLLVFLGLGFLAIGLGCKRTPTHTNDEAEIRAVLQEQVAAWNRADLTAFMEGYAKLDTTRFGSGGNFVTGWKPVYDRYRKKYTNAAAMGHLVFFDVKVDQINPDTAMVYGFWRLDKIAGNPGGVFSLLFRLRPEGWRIVHDHTSAAP
jgi:ketosteroid isomerase-like protein